MESSYILVCIFLVLGGGLCPVERICCVPVGVLNVLYISADHTWGIYPNFRKIFVSFIKEK